MYLFNFCCCRALVLFCLCFDLFQQFSIDTHCETRLILSGKWKNIAPHISFSLKRELGAAFVAKGTPFSFVFYVLTVSVLVLCGLALPLAPLALTGAENVNVFQLSCLLETRGYILLSKKSFTFILFMPIKNKITYEVK